MGFLGFLKFLLLCSDFLAWPVLALGYPLRESIRAIEAGSKNHMRKLVIYWTLFSLLSLFEIAFVKIVEWIPYWSCIKLVVICWLVVPQFSGACYVYESLVHPCLSLDVKAVINKLYKTKDDKPGKAESFLDFAEKYIKENGSEALEKLIAAKQLEFIKPDSPSTDSQVKKPEEQKAAATLEQPEKEQYAAEEEKAMLQPTKQSETDLNETKRVSPAQPNHEIWVENGSDAPAEVKEMAPPNTKAAESKHPETPPLMKVQRHWTCALCLITTTSENNLNDHLKGFKHKSKCEELRISKNAPKGTGSSPLTKDNSNKPIQEAVKKPAGNVLLPKLLNTAERPGKAQWANSPHKNGAAGQIYKRECLICDVKLISEVDWLAHIKGKRHLSGIERITKTGTPL